MAAIAIGIVLASVLALSFQYFVEYRIEQQGRDEVENSARRGIALAEARIGRAIAGLVELGRRGIAGCSAAEREALGAIAFEIMPIKELAVVDGNGAVLCTSHGLDMGEQHVASRSMVRSAAGILLEIVTVGERRSRMVRVRRTSRDGNGVAALIPAELLLAQVVLDGGSQRAHAVMVAPDGTTIVETGRKAAGGEGDTDRIVATRKSDDYGLAVTSSMSRAGLATSRADMRASAILAGVGASVLIVPLVAFGWRRRRDNPIADLRRALQADEFMPYYQPILDISNGRLEGAEVLIRWRKPDGSIVPPAQFIPLLESSGLIFEATRALMRRVCREAGPAIGRRSRCKVSFNLTARHFADDALVTEIRDIFAGSPISLSQGVLAVTGAQPLENLKAGRNGMPRLAEIRRRAAGARRPRRHRRRGGRPWRPVLSAEARRRRHQDRQAVRRRDRQRTPFGRDHQFAGGTGPHHAHGGGRGRGRELRAGGVSARPGHPSGPGLCLCPAPAWHLVPAAPGGCRPGRPRAHACRRGARARRFPAGKRRRGVNRREILTNSYRRTAHVWV